MLGNTSMGNHENDRTSFVPDNKEFLINKRTFYVMLLIINYCYPLSGSFGNDVETKDVTMR